MRRLRRWLARVLVRWHRRLVTDEPQLVFTGFAESGRPIYQAALGAIVTGRSDVELR